MRNVRQKGMVVFGPCFKKFLNHDATILVLALVHVVVSVGVCFSPVRAESKRKNIFSSASISSNGYLDQTFGLQTLQITQSDCLSLAAIC